MGGLCLSAYSLSTRPLQWGVVPGTDGYFGGRVELAYIARTGFDASRKEACARSLTGFFANSRSSSRLYASVLTGPMCTHSSRIPVVLAYASLGVRTQNSCKLRVSCRVPRTIPHPPIDKTGFGPAYKSGRNASDSFQNQIPLFC
jgi:hypothetical protein